MNLRIRSHQDFWAGLLFVAFGVAAMAIARDYPMGNATRMGPGYFPFLLGGMLVALGVAIALRALWLRGVPIGRIVISPMIIVTASILAFALGVRYAGLVPASLATVIIASLASRPRRMVEATIYAIVLAAFCSALFVWGLGLTIKLFW